ncbi:MAG TPA: HIT family protein [Caulobacteraceae bacterium]|nr:HIT family protein [Caulobacteraceae bacterium]
MTEREAFDLDAYIERSTRGPCFICRLVAGDPDYRHHVVYEDDFAIAFLNKWPVLAGYTLVCPKAHREQVTGDFTEAEYLRLQSLVRRVGEAVRDVTEAERVYILSLGSQQANRHVHWHVAPLPSGVPAEEQQFAALDVTRAGYLRLSDAEMADIARRIREALQAQAPG